MKHLAGTRALALMLPLLALAPLTALAAPKLDKETCDQLKGEQAKFMASGIASDLQKGPDWGKANLPPERLREIEHFILLDEQLKFGCRQVTLTADVLRAGEAANKIENPAPPAAAAAKPTKPKPESHGEPEKAAKPARPKAADAYQPPDMSGPPVNR